MKHLRKVHNEENLEQMLELLGFCFCEPERDSLHYYILDHTNPDDSSKQLFIWTDDCHGIIGIIKHSETESEISAISVSPEKRNSSIGRSMIMEVLQEINCKTLIAETDSSAVNFYRKCGFKIECLGEKYPGVIRYKCVLTNPFSKSENVFPIMNFRGV